MKTLLILNLLSTWSLIIFLAGRALFKYIKFEWIRRWDDEKICGVGLWSYTRPIGELPNSGEMIISLRFRKEH